MSSIKNKFLKSLPLGCVFRDSITGFLYKVVDVNVNGKYNRHSIPVESAEEVLEVDVPVKFIKKRYLGRVVSSNDSLSSEEGSESDLLNGKEMLVKDNSIVYSTLDGVLFKLTLKNPCEDYDKIKEEIEKVKKLKKKIIFEKFEKRQTELRNEILEFKGSHSDSAMR